MANILVTGSAGFIGYYLSNKLLDRGENVIGIRKVTITSKFR